MCGAVESLIEDTVGGYKRDRNRRGCVIDDLERSPYVGMYQNTNLAKFGALPIRSMDSGSFHDLSVLSHPR